MKYGRYVGAPTRAELDRVFFLDDEDKARAERRRGEHMKLGFALQMVTVRYLGCFLTDPLDVPAEVLDVVAGQMRIADPSCVKRYTERLRRLWRDGVRVDVHCSVCDPCYLTVITC